MQYLLYGVVLIACQISLALNVFAADGRLIHPVVASVQDGKGKVRVGDAVILINDEGKAVMNFIAVSLDKHCNIGGTLSSWLDVKLLDKDKKTSRRVQSCKGSGGGGSRPPAGSQ
jgi:hypothetical protein